MNMVIESVAITIQAVSFSFISMPVIYLAYCWSLSKKNSRLERISRIGGTGLTTTVLLPMKNEITRLESKLKSVIKEIEGYQEVNLMVIESDSTDGTADLCELVLKKCDLAKERWEVLRAKQPGKSAAVNMALEEITDEVVIMMDTDTHAEGWLKKIWSMMGDEDIAVISGLERQGQTNGARQTYRKTSDLIRMAESLMGSTPVVEGGLIAWRSEALSGFRINQDANADDAQIAIEGIRRGYRVIVSEGLQFTDTKHDGYDIRRSLRRSQGLSRALYSNCDLLFRRINLRTRIALGNALLTYIIVPWSVLLFCLSSPFVVTAEFYSGPNLQESLNLGFFLMLVLTKKGRALCWGSLISVISHCLFLFGKNYSIWDPSNG